MTDNDPKESATPAHQGKSVKRQFHLGSGTIDTTVIADWLEIFDGDNPKARIFHTAYLADNASSDRPVIFCMNGGPGAATVFLHFACCGPLTLARTNEGRLDTGSRALEVNVESWLNFADLVFIDPVGTGFSHLINSKEKKGEKKRPAKEKENPYWAVKGDLDAIGQFMRRFLREHKLWNRPLYYAGESYGGYRAGRLAKLLNKEYGLGMAGIIVISPIWQFRDASNSDYSSSQWINQLPTYAAIAHRNGFARAFRADTPMEEVLAAAEQFAISDYAQMLVSGDLMPAEQRAAVIQRASDMMGLDVDFVGKANGRVLFEDFARMVRSEHGEITDIYDGSQYTLDPFPHRTNNEKAIDEALFNDLHLYQNAVQQWLLADIGVETPLEYIVLSNDAHKAWKNDEKQWDLFELQSSIDDFRAGMTANSYQKAMIVHGRFDTVTPYFASRRLMSQANMDASVKARIEEVLYDGGHMFYSWPAINAQFARDVAMFVDG